MNKPSTPSTLGSSNLTNSASKGFNIQNQIGSIKRQSSFKQKNENLPSDRPSTAPTKNENKGQNFSNQNNLNSSSKMMNNTNNNQPTMMKRLPSPVIRCTYK
jgi:hypothetical protein